MPCRPDMNAWRPEEEDILRRHYGKATWEELLELLPGRTKVAIGARVTKLQLREPKEPPWAPEEVALLQELFDRAPLARIAKRLKRTETAVKLKAKRLGLRHRKRREFTPSQIGRMMRICSKIVKEWIRKGWLRARVAPTPEKEIHLVVPEHLVTCLKAHPDEWDARRCPDLHVKLGLTSKRGEAALADRPIWLRAKLAADLESKQQGKPWTTTEDVHLSRLVKQGLSYLEIGKRLGRTACAIDHRVHRLGRRIWDLAKKGA